MMPAARQAPEVHNVALERHYTVAQIASLWGWSENKVLTQFRDEPDVLQSNLPSLRPGRRRKISLRIPLSVVRRVHERLSAGRGHCD